MLSPKRVKWRKQQKGRMKGKAIRGAGLAFGEYGLQATECGRINARQLEAARIAMTRYIKRGGDIWIRIFPHKPITKKPAETRMGKGKGSVEEWAAVLKPGRMIFEMGGFAAINARISDIKEHTTKTPPMSAPFFISEIYSKKTTTPEIKVVLVRIIIAAFLSIWFRLLTKNLFWFL